MTDYIVIVVVLDCVDIECISNRIAAIRNTLAITGCDYLQCSSLLSFTTAADRWAN